MSPACSERGKLADILEEMGTELLSIVGLINTNINEPKWKNISSKISVMGNKKESFLANNSAMNFK